MDDERFDGFEDEGADDAADGSGWSRNRRRGVIIAIAVLAVGLVASIAIHFMRAEQVSVPTTEYMTEKEARSALEGVGLVVGDVTTEETMAMPEGFVISTEPASGSVADKGTRVSLKMSHGLTQVEMPDLRGMTSDEVEKTLFAAWLVPVPGDGIHSDDVEPGRVCAQSVPAGTMVDVVTTEVTYQLSLGKDRVAVPALVGSSEAEACEKLESAGLAVDVMRAYANDVANGIVMAQSVAEGTELDRGTLVSITVSLGEEPKERVQVPNVITYRLDDARRTIESAGLRFDYEGEASGTVVATEPKVWSEVDKGSIVRVTLREDKPQVERVRVPDLRGDDQENAKRRLENAGLAWEVSGDTSGRVTQTNPAPNSEVDKGSVVKVTFEVEQPQTRRVRIPDVRGDDGENAKRRLENAGLAWEVRGDTSGRVTAMDPAPNSEVDEGTVVRITFERDERDDVPEVIIIDGTEDVELGN